MSGPVPCSFLQDIRDRKEYEQRLKDFHAMVSQKLRSLLTSMGGSLALIAGGSSVWSMTCST
ncbi:MAG TPA: hypothetical protein V6D08_18500 [Candidatus Obscuribacterales bacterium]